MNFYRQAIAGFAKRTLIALFGLAILPTSCPRAQPLQPISAEAAPRSVATPGEVLRVESAGERARSEKSTARLASLRERDLPQEALFGELDTSALLSAAAGDEFSLSLPGREPKRLVTEKVVELVTGGRLWQGRLLTDGKSASAAPRAYLAMVNGAVSAFFDLAETRVEILDAVVKNESVGKSKVIVLDHAALGLSRAVSVVDDAVAPPPVEHWTAEQIRDGEAARARFESLHGIEKAAPAPQSTVDVMIAYTSGMVTRYLTTAGVQARLATLVQWANTAFSNSEVAITLRLVHSLEVSYPNGGANGTALNELTGSNGSSAVTIPASLSAIAGLRNTYGADLVALIRPYDRSTHGSCGVGWIGGFNLSDISNSAGFGYSVSSDGSDIGGSGFFCLIGTLAHELGHNFGLQHNRANSTSIGATRYAYGYSVPNSNVGDVMSYASQDAQAFANPSLGCTGVNCAIGGAGAALGIAADGPVEACISTGTGCAANQSSLCSTNSECADASRALNFVRVKVAQFRATQVSSAVTISGTTNAPNGTALCANPSSGVSCNAVSGGAYSCTVPNGWTGWLHLQAGNSNRVAARQFATGVTASQSNQNFSVTSASSLACHLDIDNDGRLLAGVDGAMLLRQMMGMNGTLATVPSTQACAQRTNQTDMATYLSQRNFDFDGTGNGASVAREGLLLLRLMLGMSGTQAVAGTGYSWPTVQAQINSACGTSF